MLKNPRRGDEVVFVLPFQSVSTACDASHAPDDVRTIFNVIPYPTERVILSCGCIFPLTTEVIRLVEQPMPVISDEGPAIQDLVIQDIETRKKIGLARYKTLLRPFNGRDVMQDLYEELIDALFYLRAEIEERKLREREVDA